MFLFNCIKCNYSSNIKCNWERHLKSNKHFKQLNKPLSTMVKSQKEPKKSQKEPKKSQKEPIFLCDFCDSKFITYANKRRHENHRCKENTIIMSNKIKTLEKEKKS
jgi:hypothetical protein